QLLVDGLRIGRVEFLAYRILMVAEDKDHLPRFPWGHLEIYLVGAHRRPTVSHRVGKLANRHGSRVVPAAVGAKKCVAAGVETGGRFRTGKIGKVVAAFAVLGLVIDDAVFHLDLAG